MKAKIFILILICVRVFHAQDFWQPVLPSPGQPLNLAINSQGDIFGSGYIRSTDGGTNWDLVNSGLPFGSYFFAINPLNDDLFASVGNNIYRSINNGDNWFLQDSTTFNAGTGRLIVNKQGILFVSRDTLRRSTDNGKTWTIVQNGLPYGQLQDLRVHSNGDIYLARKGDWIYRSSNNGDNWVKLTSPTINTPPGLDADAIAFGTGGEIYEGDDGAGFFRSTNNGSSWEQLSNGLPNTFVWAIAVNNQGHVFAGMASNGIYRSTNGGVTWDSINTGLSSSSREIYSLLITPSGYIFAGTTGGIYRSVQPVTDVGGDLKNPVTQYLLTQNYPNPFNPSTVIRYQTPYQSKIILKIYNLLGLEVATLENAVRQKGTYEVEWNASALPSGVYFYRLQAGNFSETKKLILLR